MAHALISEDEYVSCIRCGALLEDDEDAMLEPCSWRTDLVHGDPHEAGHGLECEAYATNGTCNHVAATAVDCHCLICRS
jgi:hypothetical protein